MATLIPEPGEFSDTLKLVLELSTRPRDVRIVSVQAIELPSDVLDRLNRFQQMEEEQPEQPQKRRPGRPRKNPLPEEQS